MRAYTDEAFREILAASDRQGPAAATETGGHAQPVDTPWLSDRPTELGQLAILDERFCAELSVWDVDMLVRGLICWSRDPFWDDVEPEEASCILDELRDLEQRVRAVVPPATVTSYERLIFTTLLDDELRCAHDDLRDGRDGLM